MAKARTNHKNPTPKRAIDDNFVAPKRRSKKADMTLAEAIAEQAAEDGKTTEEVLEELTAPAKEEAPVRPVGTSNLANTIRAHRRNYNPRHNTFKDKLTQDNGDYVATALLPIPLEDLKAFSAMRFDGKRYDHLNPGHARMCIGNLIRAAAKKDDPAVLEWLAAKQPQMEVGA